MLEPTAESTTFGLVAEFGEAEQLLASTRRAYDAGYRRMDAYTPFPVEGLARMLGFQDQRVPLLALGGGIVGAAIGFGMQVYTNLNYPIHIGGRPLIAIPTFLFITIEFVMIFAVFCAIGSMLVLNRLPRLNHPIFDVPSFHRASSDRFFLIIFSNDDNFDREQTRHFLTGLNPLSVTLLGPSEEPE